MPTSEAQKRASNKWIKENTESITFRVPKGLKAVLQEHAKKEGISLNTFLLSAAMDAIEESEKVK